VPSLGVLVGLVMTTSIRPALFAMAGPCSAANGTGQRVERMTTDWPR
jgi:hypothetical protein